MSKYLAAILRLCALTTASVTAVVYPAQPPQAGQENQSPDAARPNSPQDSPQNAPPAEPAPSNPEPQSAPAETAQPAKQAQPDANAKKPESPPKAARKKHRRKSTLGSATATPKKKVVRNGGTADPVVQLGPSVSPEQASSQRQNTTQLLAATDANLKQISSRQMTSGRQDSVSQIRMYMEQAKAAERAGDGQRAYNLASKALLLSDDLVKH